MYDQILLDKKIFFNEKHNEYALVTVIFPFRYSEDRPDAFKRIELAISRINNSKINIIVVDSGSEFNTSNILKKICSKYHCSYTFVDTRNEIFSIGLARDIGVILSKTKYVFFQDIDLISYDEFYDELINDSHKINKDEKIYLSYPCFYLSSDASNEHEKICESDFREYYYNLYLTKNDYINNVAVSSSAILIDRRHYMGVGGHDPDFLGHGFEDFDLISRLANLDNRYIRPRDYYTDYKSWNPKEYLGFRSYFRNYGINQLLNQKFLIHIHHQNKRSSEYIKSNENNKIILKDKLLQYDKFKTHPTALPFLNGMKTLALGDKNSAFFKSINYCLPEFGEIVFRSEHDFLNTKDFLSYLKNNKFNQVILPNPYGNNRRNFFYKALRENKIRYYVSDRGCLVDSFFFDPNGFNADSSSYHEEYWNNKLNDYEKENVIRYIRNQNISDSSLEKQSFRISKNKLIDKLKIKHNKKVLFIPLQRPSDTVCKYFTKKIGGYNNFIRCINEVSKLIDNEWIIVVKKHPLESNSPELDKNIVISNENVHFKDLLNLSSAVLLLNSGVGVHALMMNKPVITMGEAFYDHKTLTNKASTAIEVNECIHNLKKPCEESIYRFINHLLNFYSFGIPHQQNQKKSDGNFFGVTRYVDFYKINIPFIYSLERKYRVEPIIKSSSPFFDRYRTFFDNRNIIENDKKNILSTNQINYKPKWLLLLTKFF